MYGDFMASGIGWQAVPLSCRYRMVQFRALSVLVGDTNFKYRQPVRWGFGVLPGGEFEVIGAWAISGPDNQAWQGVFNELRNRGVVAIGCVVSNEPAMLDTVLRETYPGTTSSGHEDECSVLGPLPCRWRVGGRESRRLNALPSRGPKWRVSNIAAQRLQARTEWEIAHHGSFDDLTSACAFVADALKQTERGLAVGRSTGAASLGVGAHA